MESIKRSLINFLNTEHTKNLFDPIHTSYVNESSSNYFENSKIIYSKKNQFKLIAIDVATPLLDSIEHIAKALIHFIGSSFSKDCTIAIGGFCLNYSIGSLFCGLSRVLTLPVNLILTCFEKGPYSIETLSRLNSMRSS